MIIGHGGNIHALARAQGCLPADITDMSSNVNPCGPLPGLQAHLARNLELIESLPEVDGGAITRRFAEHNGLKPENVAPGNGSTQLLYALPRALGTRRALIAGPTYADYASACRQAGIAPDWLLAAKENGFRPALDRLAALAVEYDTVFICNPNNPTGTLVPPSELAVLFKACPDTTFIVDESYLPFAEEQNPPPTGSYGKLPNVVRLTSMSKIFKIPGMRIGFAIARSGLIKKLRAFAMPWSVNSLACEAVAHILKARTPADRFVRSSRRFLSRERDALAAHFKENPHLEWYPSCTSFMLARLRGAHTARDVWGALAKRRMLIRDCSNFEGLSDRFIRVSLKSRVENRRFCRILTDVLETN